MTKSIQSALPYGRVLLALGIALNAGRLDQSQNTLGYRSARAMFRVFEVPLGTLLRRRVFRHAVLRVPLPSGLLRK